MTSRISRLLHRLASYEPTSADDPSLIWAAVAIIVAPSPDAILLIRRAERVGDPWSGHMALPGGRHGQTDTTLLDTAIRESAEEVGIELTPTQWIGTLDDVAPRTPVLPPIAVRPYVFALPSRPPIIPNTEVASTHWLSVEALLHPDTYRSVHLALQGIDRPVDAYHLEDAIIWGMTERILTNLLPHLR